MPHDKEYPEEAHSKPDLSIMDLDREDLARLHELSRDLLFILDRDGRFQHVSPSALDILGWTAKELCGRPYLAGVPQDERARVTEQLERLETGPGVVLFESRYLTKSGDYADLAWTVSASGPRVLGVAHRQTPPAQNPVQDDAAGHAKTEFLASMNHELRTPLNAILGYTELLAGDQTLSSKQREALGAVRRSSQHLLLLISDILDFARLDADKLVLQPREFSVDSFVRMLTELFESRARAKNITFVHERTTPLPVTVSADETRLRQVLLNLLSNAVKFTREGGVTLRTSFEHDKLRFQVEDTGIGIPPSYLEAIFRPFEQIPQDRGFVEGTGLGLALSRRLLHLMGSILEVKSEVGKGSTFWFEIELAGASHWPSAETAAAGQMTGGQTLGQITGGQTNGQTLGSQIAAASGSSAGVDDTGRSAGPSADEHGLCSVTLSPDELQAIYDAATIGDIREILSILETAGYHEDMRMAPDSAVVEELHRMAKAFRSRQIKERVKGLLA